MLPPLFPLGAGVEWGLLLGRSPRESGGGGRRGQKAPPNAPPPLLTKLIPPVQIPHPPTPTHAGKSVSWQSGRKAKPNTLSVPRLRRRLAPRGPVCSEPAGPLERGRTLCLRGRQKPCSSLPYVPACRVTRGKSSPPGLFPQVYNEGAGVTPWTFKCFLAAEARREKPRV